MPDLSLYLNRITTYNQKPKFTATVTAVLQPFVDAQAFLEGLPAAFDIDVAIGAQLDVVGQWVNLSRNVELPVLNNWFSLGDAARGIGRGVWYNGAYSFGNYIVALDDTSYRNLLYARIAANHWDGTSAGALSVLETYFSNPATYVIADDKQTMTTYYALSGLIPDAVSLEIFSGDYLPLSAAGIRTKKLVTSVNNTPIFGLGVDNSQIAGIGTGAWGVPPSYLILNPPD